MSTITLPQIKTEVVHFTALEPLDLDFSDTERRTLRQLAERVAELAARPIEAEKRDLWRRHNRLEATRPLVFCDPENGWHEIITPEALTCQNPTAREWEFRLRKEIFWGEEMCDDRVIIGRFDVPHVHRPLDWGVQEERVGGAHGGAYTWKAPLAGPEDFARLTSPRLDVDLPQSQHRAAYAADLLGDLLPVELTTQWWWTLGMTWTLANLRGLEQLMLDMVLEPDLIHGLMAYLSAGTLAWIEDLQRHGLLNRNWEGWYVGSGGFGWTDEMPAADFDGTVRLQDMWGFAESQETVGISPQMFGEFIWPYQMPILERFGLACYGCCEPLDKRWHIVETLPNLCRVSMAPWADRARMAERLGDRYIFSMKPNPADVVMGAFDEDRIREILRRDLQATRGCHVEVILKDTHTIQNEPQRMTRWVEIALEEVAGAWG